MTDIIKLKTNSMNRRLFLLRIWKRFLQPLCLFVLLAVSLKLLVELFNEIDMTSVISVIIVLALSFIVLYTIAYWMAQISFWIRKYISSRLSEQHKMYLRIAGKLFHYIALLGLGIVYYEYWQKSWWLASILIAVHLAEKIRGLLKEEKEKSLNVPSTSF
jgi:hypothetical protein